MGRDDPVGFGELMTASHRSLREDYDVSTPALDRLVELAISRGALGARLTGAGLGGCMVALALPDRVDAVVDALTASSDVREGCVFVGEPAAGARVERV